MLKLICVSSFVSAPAQSRRDPHLDGLTALDRPVCGTDRRDRRPSAGRGEPWRLALPDRFHDIPENPLNGPQA
jgi:hypothetical protein